MCYTVIGRDFQDFVRGQIESRNEKIAEKQHLHVEVDPEILAVINASSAVSTQKGNAAHLMKINSKRRRTRAEMEEFRAMGERNQSLMSLKDARIGQLESQLHDSKSKLQAAQGSEHLVAQLMEAGLLIQNEDGTFRVEKE